MDLAIVVFIAFGIGAAAGAIAVHYIHNVASAATRATTAPSSTTVPASVTQALDGIHTAIASVDAKLTTAAPGSAPKT